MRARLRRNLDLILAALGLGLAVLLPPLIELGTDAQELAGIALLVVVVQLAVFRLVQTGQRRVLRRARRVLAERVRMQLRAAVATLPPDFDRRRLEDVLQAVQAIAATLDDLSPEALDRWERESGGLPVPGDGPRRAEAARARS